MMENNFELALRQELKKRNRAVSSPKSRLTPKTTKSMGEFEKALLSELNSRMDTYTEYHTALRDELYRRKAIAHEKEVIQLHRGWNAHYVDICKELRTLFNEDRYTKSNIDIVLAQYNISGYHITLSFSEESGILFYIEEPSSVTRQRVQLSAKKSTFQHNGIWFNSTDDLREYERLSRWNRADILKIA